MAPINPAVSPPDQQAWNDAYVRLVQYLDSFALGDRAQTSRVAIAILDQAHQAFARDSSRVPVTVTMELAQKNLADWLTINLDEKGKAPSAILSEGCLALLLSRVFRTAPEAFLATPLPDGLRQTLRATLLVAGPDIDISRMTPRDIDYGPMLDIARQTWHRWNIQELLVALIFWSAVYVAGYWLLTNYFL